MSIAEEELKYHPAKMNTYPKNNINPLIYPTSIEYNTLRMTTPDAAGAQCVTNPVCTDCKSVHER